MMIENRVNMYRLIRKVYDVFLDPLSMCIKNLSILTKIQIFSSFAILLNKSGNIKNFEH